MTYEVIYDAEDNVWDVVKRPEGIAVKSFLDEEDAWDWVDEQGDDE